MDENFDFEDEILDDVEIYEDEPDFFESQTEDELQDDDTDEVSLMGDNQIVGFLGRSAGGTVRDWKGALEWYRNHQTAAQIGFDPDGMCLKICRTARNIPAKYLSAKEAQDATPQEFRVTRIRDIRKGMVAYFDDPNDSNRFGHIVTVIGRVRGADVDSLDSLLTETNSVKSNEVVVVRASYFPRYWGDQFKFASTWLNGVEFDVPERKSKIERFNNGGPVYNLNLLQKAKDDGRDWAGKTLDRIETQIKRLPDTPKLVRVREFKDEWRATRKIDMALLDKAVEGGLKGLVKTVRDEIRRLIETLPAE